jgi:pseudoazurin
LRLPRYQKPTQRPRKETIVTIKTTLFAALAATLLLPGIAQAAEFEIKMLNKGTTGAKAAMVFEPDFVKAAIGDTVKFVAVDKGHNVEGIKGMLPDGVDPFKGEVSKDFTLTLSKEGVYGIKCAPHYGMGMVALIAAGAPVNLDAAKAVKQPGKAKPNFAALFEQLAAAQ